MKHNTRIKSFHDDESIKNAYLEKLNARYEADRHLITRRKDWDRYTYITDDNSKLKYINPALRYKIELGLPPWLKDLQSMIIYGLATEEGKELPRNVIKNIHVGSDLILVRPRFIHWCIFDLEYGYYLHTDREGRKDLSEINDLYKKIIAGKVDRKKWDSLNNRLCDKVERLIGKKGVTARNLMQAFYIYQTALGCPSRASAWASIRYLHQMTTPRHDIACSAQAKKLLELLNEATSKENFYQWDMLKDNYN